MAKSRRLYLQVDGPEWDPLFAYAETQEITPSQAARELLATALATTAIDGAYLNAVRNARHMIAKIAYSAASKALRAAREEIDMKAIEIGVRPEDL